MQWSPTEKNIRAGLEEDRGELHDMTIFTKKSSLIAAKKTDWPK